MSIWQEPPTTSLWGKLLSFHIYGGGIIHLDGNMDKKGIYDQLPEGTEYPPWLIIMSIGIE